MNYLNGNDQVLHNLLLRSNMYTNIHSHQDMSLNFGFIALEGNIDEYITIK